MLTRQDTAIRDSIDHLFRRYAGQMVSILTRRFGLEHLELVEDAVQDSLIAAMKKWAFTGEPENPRAWLIETAKNRVIDQLRRERRLEEIGDTDHACESSMLPLLAGEIEEDELRMIFACCDPEISADSQVALTLKTVGGFNVAEIARAFLSNTDAVAKLLIRAKAKLRNKAEFEIPAQDQLFERRNSVLKVLYLMFNEGYAASEGEELVRKDLCFEAIRLATIMAAHPLAGAPKVDALAALMCFQAARLETRIDDNGELLLLEDQDRTQWNRQLLSKGLHHFRLSAAGSEVSEYHLEAEIASIHALADDFASTDWQRIIECYDELQRRKFSPVVELNRIVALQQDRGSKAAAAALTKLESNRDLSAYPLFFLTRAWLRQLDNDTPGAAKDLAAAASITQNTAVKRFIVSRMAAISTDITAP